MTHFPRPTSYSHDDARRIEEVERLARAGGVNGLMVMLDDPSWSVRRAVVAALAAADGAAIGPLCQTLRNGRENEGRIAAVVDTLAAAEGDPVPSLLAMTSDAPAPVLADIAQVLGRRRASAGIPTLVVLSRHDDDNVTAAAIEALGRIGGRAAVDSLVEAVQSGIFFRVFPAIDVLGHSADPRAVAPLAALLGKQPYAAEAARALGRTGDVAAVPHLLSLLGSVSGTIVRLGAMALIDLLQRRRERFGGADAVETDLRGRARGTVVARQLARALPDGDPSEQAAICLLLGVLGDPAATGVLTTLLDAAPPVSEAAASALRALGPEVERQVLAGIRSGTSAHKRAILPFVTSRSASGDLVACLADDDPDVRALACDALARIGAVDAVRALFELLADRDARVAFAAVASIQSLGGTETERLAISAAQSDDVRVRRSALRILTYFGASAALDVFLNALADPDERVRETAISGLPFLEDPRAFEALVAAARSETDRTRASAMRSFGQCADDLRASAYLLRGLGDRDPWVRYYACQALGKLAFEPAAGAVVNLLSDPAGQVRVAAVEALSCLKGDAASGALEVAALDADQDIRRAALVGLGVAHRPATLPLVLAALGSEDPATRLVAVSALAGFRVPGALTALAAAATDSEENVRTAAIGFLAAMTGVDATRALVGLLSKTTSTEQVLSGLSLHVEGRIEGLASALESADDDVAPALTSALARMRRPDALAVLVKAMGTPNAAARRAAASALAVLASPDALVALRTAAGEDPDPDVRHICSLLLSR